MNAFLKTLDAKSCQYLYDDNRYVTHLALKKKTMAYLRDVYIRKQFFIAL